MKNIILQIFLAFLVTITGAASVYSQNVTLDFGGDIQGDPGDQITVSVTTSDLSNLDVSAFRFEISFDNDLVDIVTSDITRGALIPSGSGFFNRNVTDDNRILVAFASVDAIEGSGELFRFTFTMKDAGFNPEGLIVSDVLLGNLDIEQDVTPSIPHEIAILSGQPVDAVFLNIPETEGTRNQNISIPVETNDLGPLNIASFELDIAYNENIVQFTGVDNTGTVTEDGVLEFATPEPGLLKISVAFSEPPENGNVLVNLNATLLAQAENSPLAFASTLFQNINGDPVNVTTSDGTLNVSANVPPEFETVLEDTSVSEEEAFFFQYEAVDLNNDELSFTLLDGPDGATVDPATGIFQYEPEFGDAGIYTVQVGVTDGIIDQPVTTSAVLTVLAVNRAPEFVDVLPDTSTEEGRLLEFTYTAFDPDVELGRDELAFSLDDAPDGATIDVETGEFRWTPEPHHTGEHMIRAVVTDTFGASDTTTAVVSVDAFAMAQIIHNAADPAAASVDIYVNGQLFVSELAFREATPFVDVPANTALDLAIYPAGSDAGDTDPVFSMEGVEFAFGGTYTVIANGVLGEGFAANPDGVGTDFNLFIVEEPATEAPTGEVSFFIWHGVPDAPAVDVWVAEGPLLADGAAYTEFTDVITVDADEYTLYLGVEGSAATGEALFKFVADLSGAGGLGAAVLASGFLSPENNENGSVMGLLVALPDGTTLLLDALEPTSTEQLTELPNEFKLEQNYPNPFNPSTNIVFSVPQQVHVSIDVYAINGQKIMSLVNEIRQPGQYEVTMDGSQLSSGIYLYRMTAGEFSQTRKLMLVK